MDRALEEQVCRFTKRLRCSTRPFRNLEFYEKCWNNFLASLLSILPEALIDLDLETIRSRVSLSLIGYNFEQVLSDHMTLSFQKRLKRDIRPALHRLASPDKMGFYGKTERVQHKTTIITVLPLWVRWH